MDSSLPFKFETLRLQNRVGRLTEVSVCCLQFRNQFLVFLRALPPGSYINLAKNMDGYAHQIRSMLDCDGEQLEIFQVQSEEEETVFERWRFQWVGNSAIKPVTNRVPARVLYRGLEEGSPEVVSLTDGRKVGQVA